MTRTQHKAQTNGAADRHPQRRNNQSDLRGPTKKNGNGAHNWGSDIDPALSHGNATNAHVTSDELLAEYERYAVDEEGREGGEYRVEKESEGLELGVEKVQVVDRDAYEKVYGEH
ncbi:hypothetical protein HDV00_001272 [Rhizophlyctis rosea]|nr:hypothetical protein HDV00_001272 [Rhizophlyctis rosea]